MGSFYLSDHAIEDGARLIRVGGYLDFDLAPQFKKCVVRRIEEGDRLIIIDLSDVGFIDSTAIGVLVGALKRLREVGGSLADRVRKRQRAQASSRWSASKTSFRSTIRVKMRSQPLRKPSDVRHTHAGDGDFASREFRLLSHPSELRRARCHVDEAAAEFGLDPTGRYQFVFAVNEAVTNAIRYGRPSPEGTIGLRLAAEGNTLSCSVYDRGHMRAPSPDIDPLAEGGRGLTLMALMTDEIEVLSDRGGTTVLLYKTAAGRSSGGRGLGWHSGRPHHAMGGAPA